MKQNIGRFVDITGKTFNHLTVVEYVGKSMWRCKCACGNERVADSYAIRTGVAKSCGCTKGQAVAAAITKHGYSSRRGQKAPEYVAWRSMLNRCDKPYVAGYRHYGGRGITVCSRWRRFENFIADMGNKPSPEHSIDRIDVDGNYTPENCRWATRAEQANNKSDTIYVEYLGRRVPVCQLARELGQDIVRFRARILRGWSVEKAISVPRRARTLKHERMKLKSHATQPSGGPQAKPQQ